MNKKVVIGMSGGVDSSVAAFLLKKQGYEVIGVTMKMWQEDGKSCPALELVVEDAKKVADLLEIPHYVADFRDGFKEHVVDDFVSEYLHGRTPNPCIVCNRFVKWEMLLEFADKMGADYIATGHYARIDKMPNGRYAVKTSVTANKDQTYALYRLTQEQLARTLMPVGEYEKQEIRGIAKEIGISVADKPDSQEICFIPDNDYASFIHRQAGDAVPKGGNFVKTDGSVIGPHQGIIHYTIGQRKGLNLAMGHPVFVTEIRPDTKEVVIGEAEDVFSTVVICDRINFMGLADLEEPYRAMAKIRYSHKGSMATLERFGEDKIRCTFDEPVRAVTPGQAVVFYEDGYVLGGGTII